MAENANHSRKISFSQDFPEFESIPIEKSPSRSPTRHYPRFSFDLPLPFEVMTGESSWSAEEIISDGQLLPIGIKEAPHPRDLKLRQLPVQRIPSLYKPDTYQIRGVHEIEEVEVPNSGMWFNRTNSVDCESGSPLLQNKESMERKRCGGYSYKGNGGGIKVNSWLDMIPSGSLFGLGSIMVGSGSNNTQNKKRTMFFTW